MVWREQNETRSAEFAACTSECETPCRGRAEVKSSLVSTTWLPTQRLPGFVKLIK